MTVNTLLTKLANGKTAVAVLARDVVDVDAVYVHFISTGLNGTLKLTKKLEGQLPDLNVAQSTEHALSVD